MSLAVTPGSGATLALDQIGTPSAPAAGQLISYVKLDMGAAGSSNPTTALNPLAVQVSNGTQTMPTGDAAARAVFTSVTDGTNKAAVKAASTGAALTDPALVVAMSPNCALSAFKQRGLVGTVVSVKASAGALYAVQVTNQDANPAYIQFFNVAAASVTLGTTVPDLEFVLPAGSTTVQMATPSFPDGIPFGTAMSVASTTTSGGATGSAAAKVNLHAQYA